MGYAGNNITSLAAMQNITGQDTHSISQNPGFLIVASFTYIRINHVNKPLSLLSVDMDGKARTMITNMDVIMIFLPLALDVKLESILSPTSLTPGSYNTY